MKTILYSEISWKLATQKRGKYSLGIMVVKMIGRMKVGHKCQSCEVKGKEKRMCENTDFLRQEN